MTTETVRTPSGFKNVNLTPGGGSLSGTPLPTGVTADGAPTTILGVTVPDGSTQDFLVGFVVANITQDPDLDFQPVLGSPAIASVQNVSVFGSGVLPNGLFEIFYTVTIQRDQVPTGTGFLIPILTLDGVSGTTTPLTVDLQ